MSDSPVPSVILSYAGVNISKDISRYLISITYTDNVHGKSDEIEVELEDVDGRWRNEWYPKKGDKINLKIGYAPKLLDCGEFQVDEIALHGPPDTVTFRALGSGIKSSTRTKKSKAHEESNLKQIAQYVAKEHGYTIQDGSGVMKIKHEDTKSEQVYLGVIRKFMVDAGNSSDANVRYSITLSQAKRLKIQTDSLIAKGYPDQAAKLINGYVPLIQDRWYGNFIGFAKTIDYTIAELKAFPPIETRQISGVLQNITLGRKVQRDETDLAFLKKMCDEYGIAFSIKGTIMVFIAREDLEKQKPSFKIARTDLMAYELKDTSAGTYKKASVTYHNPKTGQVVDSQYSVENKKNGDGFDYTEIHKDDTLVVKSRSENKQQADAKAKAALNTANRKTIQGSVSIPGNPLAVAGVNFGLTDMGELSGTYHIDKSTHKIERGEGWTIDLEVKNVQKGSKAEKKAVKKVLPQPTSKDSS